MPTLSFDEPTSPRALEMGLWFDEKEADRVIKFFTTYIKHIKGEWAGKTLQLAPWQEAMLRELFGWKRADGTRRYRTAYWEIPRKQGKALALDTPIPTPEGWKLMGDLKAGDKVFDENGIVCNVVVAGPVQYNRPCYELTFSEGTKVVADAEHEWLILSSGQEIPNKILTSRELATNSVGPKLISLSSHEITINSIKETNSVPVRCIQVDSKSHLFLCGKGMIPTHNSFLAAGIVLYCFLCDKEPGAEVYSAAADRAQAKIVFDTARAMLQANPKLASQVNIYAHHITNKTGGIYKALSAEAYTKDGLNAHVIVVDELHAQPNRELWDVLTTSMGARRQPITLAITTAGWDRQSICYEIRSYAERVRDGIIDDPTFFSCIYAADPEDDWTDPKVWRKANPGLGISIKEDYLREQCAKAKENPAAENTFRRLHLNQWTEGETRWIPLHMWKDCSSGPIDERLLAGKRCWGGLDLSNSNDITALVWIFEDGPDGFLLIPRFWIPKDNIKLRVRKDKVPYDSWEKQGYLIATPGNVIDYKYIKNQIYNDLDTFEVKELAFDRWGSKEMMQELEEAQVNVMPFGQGFKSMGPASKTFFDRVKSGKLRHGNNPVLNWMINNVVVATDPQGNVKPDKNKSSEKIDGVVATIMGLERAALCRQEKAKKKSKYETQGLAGL